jgi:hypothetical protein
MASNAVGLACTLAVAVWVSGCNFPENELVGVWTVEQNADGAKPSESTLLDTLTFTNEGTYSRVVRVHNPGNAANRASCTEVETEQGTYRFTTTGGCSSYDWTSGVCQSYSTPFDSLSVTPESGYGEITGCENPDDDVNRVTYGPSDFEEQLYTVVDFYNDGTAMILGSHYTKQD